MRFLAFLISMVVVAIDFVISWKLINHDYKKDRLSEFLGIGAFMFVQFFAFAISKSVFDSFGV